MTNTNELSLLSSCVGVHGLWADPVRYKRQSGVVWIDDVQICDLSASRRYAELAGLHITVRPAAPAPPLTTKGETT